MNARDATIEKLEADIRVSKCMVTLLEAEVDTAMFVDNDDLM